MPPKKAKKTTTTSTRHVEIAPKPPLVGEGAYYAPNGSVRQVKHSELCKNTATTACAACGVTICFGCGWRCSAHECFNHFCDSHKEWARNLKCPHAAFPAPTSKNEAPAARVWHVVSGTKHESERVVEVASTKEEARVVARMVMDEKTYDPDYEKWTETEQDHWENLDQYIYIDERAVVSKSADSRVHARRRASSKNELPDDALSNDFFRGLFEYESVVENVRGDKTFHKCTLLKDVDRSKKGETYDKIKWRKLNPGVLEAIEISEGGGKSFRILRDWDPLHPTKYVWTVFEGEAHEGGNVVEIVDNEEAAIAVAKSYMEIHDYGRHEWKETGHLSWESGCNCLSVDEHHVILKPDESYLYNPARASKKKRKVENDDDAAE